MWAQAPDGARRTLPVLVSRLRRLLEAAEPGSGVELVHRAGGYVLVADRTRWTRTGSAGRR